MEEKAWCIWGAVSFQHCRLTKWCSFCPKMSFLLGQQQKDHSELKVLKLHTSKPVPTLRDRTVNRTDIQGQAEFGFLKKHNLCLVKALSQSTLTEFQLKKKNPSLNSLLNLAVSTHCSNAGTANSKMATSRESLQPQPTEELRSVHSCSCWYPVPSKHRSGKQNEGKFIWI